MASVRSLSRRLSYLRNLVKRNSFPLNTPRVERSIQFYTDLIQYHPDKSPLFADSYQQISRSFANELLGLLQSNFPVRDWMDLCATFEIYDREAESLLDILLEEKQVSQTDSGTRRLFEKL